jgi:tetratricopeptide (TPR) repeat protein
MGTIMRGWSLVMQGYGTDYMAQQRQGLMDFKNTGAEHTFSCYLALQAESYEKIEESEKGLASIAEAMRLDKKNGIHGYDAELYRLKGTLLLQQSAGNAEEAESCCHQAMQIAREQSAKSWQLRAATSLARHWQRQGKPDAASALLAPIFCWRGASLTAPRAHGFKYVPLASR